MINPSKQYIVFHQPGWREEWSIVDFFDEEEEASEKVLKLKDERPGSTSKVVKVKVVFEK